MLTYLEGEQIILPDDNASFHPYLLSILVTQYHMDNSQQKNDLVVLLELISPLDSVHHLKSARDRKLEK